MSGMAGSSERDREEERNGKAGAWAFSGKGVPDISDADGLAELAKTSMFF